MPFKKGVVSNPNQKGKPKPKTEQWNNIVGWLVTDGGFSFLAKLKDLSSGQELTRPEMDFIEHYERLLEYHKPKLARHEEDITSNGESIVLKLD